MSEEGSLNSIVSDVDKAQLFLYLCRKAGWGADQKWIALILITGWDVERASVARVALKESGFIIGEDK